MEHPKVGCASGLLSEIPPAAAGSPASQHIANEVPRLGACLSESLAEVRAECMLGPLNHAQLFHRLLMLPAQTVDDLTRASASNFS